MTPDTVVGQVLNAPVDVLKWQVSMAQAAVSGLDDLSKNVAREYGQFADKLSDAGNRILTGAFKEGQQVAEAVGKGIDHAVSEAGKVADKVGQEAGKVVDKVGQEAGNVLKGAGEAGSKGLEEGKKVADKVGEETKNFFHAPDRVLKNCCRF